MYTFRRPQQQQQQQQEQRQPFVAGEMNAGDGEEGVITYATAPDRYDGAGEDMAANNVADRDGYNNNDYGTGEITAMREDGGNAAEQREEMAGDLTGQPEGQASGGQISEETSAEDVLQYCREMILRRHITPPPQWRRVRVDLPASIAELRLTPSAPEPIQLTPPITPSPCVVLQLDNSVPEGMTTKEYAKSLVKYVMDLLAYQRASTAITSLRFVKIGTELSQLVLTFGRDVQLASLVLGEFAKVGLRAGFGAPVKEHVPNATFRVTDYYMTLHDGTGITTEDITALLGSKRSPQDIIVLAGYEPGVFYAAMRRPETVYAWLWNPFCSFVVQRTLFEQCGVLVTMADCPHEFAGRSGATFAAQQQKGRGRRELEGDDHNNNDDGMADSGVEDDDDDDENDDDDVDDNFKKNGENDDDAFDGFGRGGRAAKNDAPAWTRNAKEEIDIFEGVEKQTTRQAAFPGFVDDDITELLHQLNAEKHQQQQQSQKQKQEEEVEGLQQQPAMYAGTAPPVVSYDHSVDGMMASMPYTQAPAMQQQNQSQYAYYGGGPLLPPWQKQHQQQPQLLGKTVPSMYGTMPPSNDIHVPPREQNVNYPKLVDEDNTNNTFSDTGNEEDMESKSRMAQAQQQQQQQRQQQQQQQPRPMYWIPGGESIPVVGNGGILYPVPSPSPYLTHPFFPSIQLPLQPNPIHDKMNAMPSILGQPVYSTLYNSVGVRVGIQNNTNQHSNVGILARPPTNAPLPLPRVMTVERAQELASRVVELARIVFTTSSSSSSPPPPPAAAAAVVVVGEETAVTLSSTDKMTELDATVLVTSPEKEMSSTSEALFPQVPWTATVPRMSAEMEDLISFIREEYVQLKEVIENSSPEMQESHRRIVSALLTHRSHLLEIGEAADWNPQEESNMDEERTRSLQLPALLPYLLATTEGTELVSAIASNDTEQLLPLLTRYVLPFLLDVTVVRSVVTVALRAEPTAENPLVKRILRHWEALANWLHEYINCQAAAAEVRAEGEIEHASATLPPSKSTTKSNVVRRLTSHVGNTMDMLLAAMSAEQRTSTKAYLDTTKALDTFLKSLQTVEQRESAQDIEVEGEEQRTAVVSQKFMTTLWSTEGAIHRSLMRLYLNANLLDGTKLVDLLFAPQSSLTRDQYYFVLVAFSKSLVSQVLSEETARACGAFLRLMEQKFLNVEPSTTEDNVSGGGGGNNNSSSSSSTHVLTEKDAVHLVDTALRAIASAEVYSYLRDAYFIEPPPMRRYEKVETKLARPTLPVSSFSAPPGPQQHSYQQQQQQQQGADGQNVSSRSGWQAEWTAAMRNYPQLGDPFTPLPTGWTSALSRSYGHYYFKNAKGTATYKHPTDAAEFMATPQAFLQEHGVTITLADVLAYANNKGSSKNDNANNSKKTDEEEEEEGEVGVAAPSGEAATKTYVFDNAVNITEEQAENWFADQRMRVEALDMATLALLKVKYRVGGVAGRSGGHSRGRSSRHRRDSSESHRHHSHYHNHHHQTRKRARGSPLNTLELQRKLVKMSSYPPRGHPFLPLPRGWTCNLSSSNGLYYFRPPRGNPVYQHPVTRREYRASPQAFVLHHGIYANAIAVEAHKSVEEVEGWLADQRQRDEVLDAAVVLMVPIEYASCPDYDEDDAQAESDHHHHKHQKQQQEGERQEYDEEEKQQQQQQGDEHDGSNSHRSVTSHNPTTN
ncbi:hypothetical protein TcYC6_0065860 [Trypanosoma cruzi]|nr:hypothetical protein TcYC6_0065860 [Trypanosoma cruzi]